MKTALSTLPWGRCGKGFDDPLGLEANQSSNLDEGDCPAGAKVGDGARAAAYQLRKRGLVYQLGGLWCF